jgi:formate dehydrogenase major subunit
MFRVMINGCVRICEEVQGQFVWHIWNRGVETRVVPDSGTNLRESSCVSCGACVDTCPTGALEDKSMIAFGTPTRWTKTTCAYCGTGCEMAVGTRDGRIVSIHPALDGPVNKRDLCVKGRYAFEYVYAADRITDPLIRVNGYWKAVSWEKALDFRATELRRLMVEHGPDSIGVLGTGAATNSLDDIERAHTILLCGANATENHPIVGARIKEQALRGVAAHPLRAHARNNERCVPLSTDDGTNPLSVQRRHNDSSHA